MKVLLLFPMADGQTGPAIKYAFEQLGHEVETVDAKRHPLLSYSIACGYKPDLVFCSRTHQLTDEVKKIKKRFKDAPICMWNVDTRDTLAEWEHLFPLIKAVDYHFVVETNLLPEWRRELNTKTFWLPQGLQNEVYGKPRSISEEDRQKYECDICFCGGIPPPGIHHRDRRPIMEAIIKAGFRFNVWGSEGMPQVYNEEHNKQTSLAKISLGISGWPEVGKYVSVRDYKIMGAGGFLLERQGDGLADLFPPDLIGTYVSLDDLIDRIHYWLDHEKERKAIAERGYKWVHENATYTHRIKQALVYMEM